MNVAGRERKPDSILRAKQELSAAGRTTQSMRSLLLPLLLFSIFYFSYTLVLASGRYLTVDEISTVIVASSPNLTTIWESPKHVLDFQTAISYIVFRASRALFGGGLIATRLPSILGMYTFCVCLFFFAWRRIGVLGATVAMIFPIITGAFPYSCEARPYGPVMGCVGLALLFWQLSEDGIGRKWFWAFSLSLFGALALHPFAVCAAAVFLVPEFLLIAAHRRIRLARLGGVIVPIAIAAFTYLPVAEGFRTFAPDVRSGQDVIVLHNLEGAIETTYTSLLGRTLVGSSLTVFILCIAAIFVQWGLTDSVHLKRSHVTWNDLIIGIVVLLSPIGASVLALLLRSIFFPRYIAWAVGGAALLLAFGTGAFTRRNYTGIAVMTIVVLTAARNFSIPLHKRLEGQVWNPYALNDPTARYVGAGDPVAVHELLNGNLPNAAILCTSLKEFVYLEYNSAGLRSRLRYIYAGNPDYGASYITSFRTYYKVFTSPLNIEEATSEFPRFLFYGPIDTSTFDLIRLLQKGARVVSYQISTDGTHLLAELQTARQEIQ